MRGLAFRTVVTYLQTLASEEDRSEEHTSELQSLRHLVCRLLLEKKKKNPTARGTRAIVEKKTPGQHGAGVRTKPGHREPWQCLSDVRRRARVERPLRHSPYVRLD